MQLCHSTYSFFFAVIFVVNFEATIADDDDNRHNVWPVREHYEPIEEGDFKSYIEILRNPTFVSNWTMYQTSQNEKPIKIATGEDSIDGHKWIHWVYTRQDGSWILIRLEFGGYPQSENYVLRFFSKQGELPPWNGTILKRDYMFTRTTFLFKKYMIYRSDIYNTVLDLEKHLSGKNDTMVGVNDIPEADIPKEVMQKIIKDCWNLGINCAPILDKPNEYFKYSQNYADNYDLEMPTLQIKGVQLIVKCGDKLSAPSNYRCHYYLIHEETCTTWYFPQNLTIGSSMPDGIRIQLMPMINANDKFFEKLPTIKSKCKPPFKEPTSFYFKEKPTFLIIFSIIFFLFKY